MKNVTIYTTPSCSYCHLAKRYFKENHISYEEKDVAQDAKARQDMIEKSGQLGVPVIEIGEDIVVGFNLPVIKELLGSK